MPLSAAQLSTLKADIAANNNTIPASGFDWIYRFGGVQIKNIPVNDGDGKYTIAGWYSLVASPAFLVFRSDIPNSEIFNQVLWANYTPSDAITSIIAAQWTAASMACQGKQFNLQIMLQPGGVFNAGLVNLRTGLKDATMALPSAASFNTQDGGWNTSIKTVPGVLTRSSTNLEKLFATFTTGPLATGSGVNLGQSSNVALMVVEGPLSGQDVLNAWAAA